MKTLTKQEALYILNKEAKKLRDEKNEIAEYLYNNEYGIEGKSIYAIEPNSGIPFKSESDYDEWMTNSYMEPDEASDVADDICMLDIAGGYNYTEEEWDNYMSDIDNSIEEIEKDHEKIAELKEKINELYMIKEEILNKSKKELKCLGWHDLEIGIANLYQWGNYKFHLIEDEEIGDELVEMNNNVSSECNSSFVFDDAIKFLKSCFDINFYSFA